MSDANAEEVAALRAVAETAKRLTQEVNDWVLIEARPGIGNTNAACIRHWRDELRLALARADRAEGAARSPGASQNAAGPSTGDAGAVVDQLIHACITEQVEPPGRHDEKRLRAAFASILAAATIRERASVSPGSGASQKVNVALFAEKWRWFLKDGVTFHANWLTEIAEFAAALRAESVSGSAGETAGLRDLAEGLAYEIHRLDHGRDRYEECDECAEIRAALAARPTPEDGA